MKFINYYVIIITLLISYSCDQTSNIEPEAIGPIPSQRQLAWHELEYYGFIHFNMNTFTDMEWGGGGESPETFRPTQLDTRQWARTAKEAGMKGLILTAKHHDGFCLWPTETTEHSVKNSPWKNGKGDVVKELAEACEEFGIKFGVYLSPWDRNHPEYGRKEYVEVFHKQLEELMTNYGPIFEVWFDGANGGTGYYGGANENRKIDHRDYYDWDKVISIIRKHQPKAVIFGDNGPDIRWIGNEEGIAGRTNWSLINKDEMFAGSGRHKELQFGHEDGTHWVPGEADVSIRPGWYYHRREDHQVKTLPHLLNIYYKSVGRNASLLLNLPVDTRGLVHENDVEQLMKLRRQLDLDFRENLGDYAKALASSTAGFKFRASNVLDNDDESYWMPEVETSQSEILLNFEKPTQINRFLVQEYIALGQRVKSFKLEGRVDGEWVEIDAGTTIGYKRILRFDPIIVSALSLKIEDTKGPPLITNIKIYNAPPVMEAPDISQDKNGNITLKSYEQNLQVFYTLDGKDPNKNSRSYSEKFLINQPTRIKAVSYNPYKDAYSEISTFQADIPKKNWKVLNEDSAAEKIIDTDENSVWTKKGELPQQIVIDLGELVELIGFTYLPQQSRWPEGVIADYELLVSENGDTWRKVMAGEFSNIKNNPIEQRIEFEKTNARYIKFIGKRSADETGVMGFAEIGVITR